jgi:molybdopterin synthase catalytic subunit
MACDDFVEVVAGALDLNKYIKLVEDPGAGAIATFSGVTRDNCEGKKVVSLSYEAYAPMAERQMRASTRMVPDNTFKHSDADLYIAKTWKTSRRA